MIGFAAETGDAKTQERLGDLLSGPRVEVNDFERALDYYQAAADQGRPAAALKVGQDYATGLVRPRDLEKPCTISPLLPSAARATATYGSHACTAAISADRPIGTGPSATIATLWAPGATI